MRFVDCDSCGANMRVDKVNMHKNTNACRIITCSICNNSIPYLSRLRHKKTHDLDHSKDKDRATIVSGDINMPPYHIDDDYSDIYQTFGKYIKSNIQQGKLSTVYNFQLFGLYLQTIAEHFNSVFSQQTESFRVTISMSYILKNIEINELAFYSSSLNNQCLLEDKSRIIRNDGDRAALYNEIMGLDLQQRVIYPNTKFIFVKATSVTFYVTKLPGVAIGSPVKLPSYLINNKGLYSLVKSAQTGAVYDDKLCFFRCLASFRGFKLRFLENETKRLLRQFCDSLSISISEFEGITLDQLEDASKIFGVGINVYTQDCDRHTTLIFRSIRQDNILYLNLYEDHFSFVHTLDKFSSSYSCQKSCGKVFSRHWDFKRHMKSCDSATKAIYSNGVYRLPKTIFEELELHGIIIPQELRFYEYRITFDIECTLVRDTDISDTARISYTFQHELASISICSNVPEYTEPLCLISDGSPENLVKSFLQYMSKIAFKAANIQKEKFSSYLPDICSLADLKVQEKFNIYINQIPVLSFNGAKYDLKVMRKHLIPALVEMEKIQYVIKRGSSYTCIMTENFKFLDIISYLAAGVNYDSFLKAYCASNAKSYFPYEWFNDLKKLNSTEFPPYDAFHSSLKMRNTLEPSTGSDLTDEEVRIIRRIPPKDSPLIDTEKTEIGHFRYFKIKDLFTVNGWSMREYLAYYNNLDTGPFLMAVHNMSQYYIERGVDIFKDSVSGN